MDAEEAVGAAVQDSRTMAEIVKPCVHMLAMADTGISLDSRQARAVAKVLEKLAEGSDRKDEIIDRLERLRELEKKFLIEMAKLVAFIAAMVAAAILLN